MLNEKLIYSSKPDIQYFYRGKQCVWRVMTSNYTSPVDMTHFTRYDLEIYDMDGKGLDNYVMTFSDAAQYKPDSEIVGMLYIRAHDLETKEDLMTRKLQRIEEDFV